MYDMLKTLFLDNPYIPEQIYTFCNRLPEFRDAEKRYNTRLKHLEAQLGREEASDLEEVFADYLAQYVHAYYLFGLSLRQEVLFALEQA